MTKRNFLPVVLNAKDGYAIMKQILKQSDEEFMMVMTDDPQIDGQNHDLRFVPHSNHMETCHTLHLKADGTWTLQTMVEA